MNITYLGQSAFLVKTKGKNLLFDPAMSYNPLAKNLNINDISCDYILLTHGHEDHVADAELIAKANEAVIISNFEIVSWYAARGVKGHPMNTGGKWSFDFGTVKSVSAIHSSVMPDGAHGGNSGGFVVWNEEACFYHAGDTALSLDMQLIPRTCPKLDFAILPIGDNFTMGYEDAVLAAEFINCDTIIGCHYDSFGYIVIDHEKAKEAFAAKGKRLILLNIGEQIIL